MNEYSALGAAQPAYDDDGNMIDDGTKQLSYNAENQLKSVTVPSVSVSTYEYDYLGRRARKSAHALDGSLADYVATSTYSGWNKIQETKSVSGGSTTVKNWVWGLDLSRTTEGAGGIGGLVAVVDGSRAASLFAYDGSGNVSELIATNGGNVGAHYEYDAFGNIVASTQALVSENCYRFSTKCQDNETGMIYYRCRYYSPDIGRWTQRDLAPSARRTRKGLLLP